MFKRRIKKNNFVIDSVNNIEEALNTICIEPKELNNLRYQKLLEIYCFEFPKKFEEYINKINGSIIGDMYVKINKNVSKYYAEELSVMNFLLFEYSDELYSVSNYIEDINNVYPEMIPIARDAADNLFCISKKDGAIYFFDREEFFENELYYIASSFDEFIKLFIFIN